MKLTNMRLLHDGYIKTYRLTYETKSGRLTHYQIVSRRRLENNPEPHDNAVMACVRCEGKILVVSEFRQGINQTVLSLPCGLVKQGREEPLAAIKRELCEECVNSAHPATRARQFSHTVPTK